MKKYLSYSEMYSWLNYRDDYYKHYIEGEIFEPNEKMILGTIVHKAMENPNFEWIKELKANGFNKNQQMMVRTILTNCVADKGTEPESTLTAETPEGTKLLCIVDSLDRSLGFLWEYKTCDSDDRWFQRMVDYNRQLSFCAYVYWLNCYQYFHRMRLVRMNVATGSVRRYDTCRSRRDITEMAKLIKTVVSEMKAEGIWEKRISSKDAIAKASQSKKNV